MPAAHPTSLLARAVTVSGGVAGVSVGAIPACRATAAPFALFVVLVVVGSVGTRLGRDRKIRLGVQQERGGRGARATMGLALC